MKVPHKVGQPAAVSHPGWGPLAGPPRDGARHGCAMHQWFALRTGHPMKGSRGWAAAGRPDGIRWRQGQITLTSVTLPPREEASTGQIFLLLFVATGPSGGKPAELPGLAPVPAWDLLPGGAFPHQGFPACSNLFW